VVTLRSFVVATELTGPWYKEFPGRTLCAASLLVKTFLRRG